MNLQFDYELRQGVGRCGTRLPRSRLQMPQGFPIRTWCGAVVGRRWSSFMAVRWAMASFSRSTTASLTVRGERLRK